MINPFAWFAVQQAERKLDRWGPEGWRGRLTVPVRAQDPSHCPLSMVYGGYSTGLDALCLTVPLPAFVCPFTNREWDRRIRKWRRTGA